LATKATRTTSQRCRKATPRPRAGRWPASFAGRTRDLGRAQHLGAEQLHVLGTGGIEPARDLAAVGDDRAAAPDDHVAADDRAVQARDTVTHDTEPETAPVSVRVHAAREPGSTVDLKELAGPMLTAASIA
jgi:hypothetical protein